MTRAILSEISATTVLLLMAPVIVFVWFGGLVSGIALAIDGEWGLILWGFGALIAAPIMWVVGSIPNLGIAIASNWMLEKSGGNLALVAKPIGAALAVFGIAYIVLLTFIVVTGVVYYLPELAGMTGQTNWKVSLWSCSVSASVFSVMASKEQNNWASDIVTFSAAVLSLLYFVSFLLAWHTANALLAHAAWFIATTGIATTVFFVRRQRK